MSIENKKNRAELIEALFQASREQSTRTIMFHQALTERLGLNATDHKCLDILSRTGSITAGKLAELTGLTTGAVTGVIDRLEKAGFVRRAKDPDDRRRVVIEISLDKAKAAFEPLFVSLGEAMNKLLSQYSEQELAILLDYILQTTIILQEETKKLK